MPVKFEDGSNFDGEDWGRLIAVIQQRAKEGKPKPVEIKQGSITVKVKGYEPKANSNKNPEYANFIESEHKGWKIRVWRIERDEVYGCNFFMGENVNYLEVAFGNVLDENGVFTYVSSLIDDMN